ncbi:MULTISPECIES: DUF3558 family protein [Corynebacterium]|uniref:DUF3558 family protein n=1 Tax=Corynebacterium TaxID=1716 RepID=UPI00124C8C95|nr:MULTISPECIES: DUF3558 family protein [Corynebacterium]
MRNLRHSAVQRRRALGTALALALITTSGCAAATGQEETEEATSNTTKEDSTTTEEAGTELSDWFEATSENFDYQAPGFELFNPCAEIPENVIATAGLNPPVEEIDLGMIQQKGCFYTRVGESGFSYLVAADTIPLATLEKTTELHEPMDYSHDPKVHTFSYLDSSGASCGVSSYTQRGRLSVILQTHEELEKIPEVCSKAHDSFYKIFQNLRLENLDGNMHR